VSWGSSLTSYAWVWLIVGVVLIAASFLILIRSRFARWIGFGAAAIAAVSAMTWMPYYPVWSFVYVGIAVLTVYALARYGGREPVVR
jgi:membrane protein implicated in regulation of membrane protease activity